MSAKRLINPDNSESCGSALAKVVSPEPEDEREREVWVGQVASLREDIKSYLLYALGETSVVQELEDAVVELAKNTYAYHIVDERQKGLLLDVFLEVGRELVIEEPDLARRKTYAKSLLSLSKQKQLLSSLVGDIHEIAEIDNELGLLTHLWPRVYSFMSHDYLRAVAAEDVLPLCQDWIAGAEFTRLQEVATGIVTLPKKHKNMDGVVEICENAFGFRLTLVLSAVADMLSLTGLDLEEQNRLKQRLSTINRMVKCGLPSAAAATAYELGLVDRELAMKAVVGLETASHSRGDVILHISQNEELRHLVSSEYPSYFRDRLDRIVGRS
jgi:hypothetical protein